MEEEKITRRNGRLFFRILTLFMIQVLITMFCFDYYYWQKIPVPDYFGLAICILMCMLAMHMFVQKQVSQSLKALIFVVEHPYNFRS